MWAWTAPRRCDRLVLLARTGDGAVQVHGVTPRLGCEVDASDLPLERLEETPCMWRPDRCHLGPGSRSLLRDTAATTSSPSLRLDRAKVNDLRSIAQMMVPCACPSSMPSRRSQARVALLQVQPFDDGVHGAESIGLPANPSRLASRAPARPPKARVSQFRHSLDRQLRRA